MPITKQAMKKLRHDRVRSLQTGAVRQSLRKLIKEARIKPGKKSLSAVYQALDKAVGSHIIHKNKATRLKSRLAHLKTK